MKSEVSLFLAVSKWIYSFVSSTVIFYKGTIYEQFNQKFDVDNDLALVERKNPINWAIIKSIILKCCIMLKCCILLKRCVMLCLDGVADASLDGVADASRTVRKRLQTFANHPSLPAWEVAISLVPTETLQIFANGLVGWRGENRKGEKRRGSVQAKGAQSSWVFTIKFTLVQIQY